jgi:outer membrane protein assembly factor BamD (BamD/ComL family)
MNLKSVLLLAILVVFFSGCSPSREKTIKNITTLETQLYSGQAMNFNRPKADSLLNLYDKFVTRYPKDSLAPKYLFQAASLAVTLGDGKKSLDLYEDFMKKFPDNPKTPVCLFFKGYIYENLLSNLDKAKETYLVFIEKYPDHEFVKDARVALMNLGKTPDQLVREFEEKQKAESARIADSITALKGKKRKK